MWRWTKRIAIAVLVLAIAVVLLGVFVRYQGVQYVAAYTWGGFANPLPAADAYPTENNAGENPCASGPLTVMTYNIFNGSALVEALVERFAEGDLDGFRPWSERVPEIRERIAGYDPDLIGFQEMGADADVLAAVPETPPYTLVSYRLGALEYGDSALLFKSERFELLDSGQLWLSPCPRLPLAYGFQRRAMIRYVNWAVLREKDGAFTFLFANTHFDNNGPNKEPSATLFRERITALAQGMPLIATGDFNSNGTTDRYHRFTGADQEPPLLQNVFTLAKKRLEAQTHGPPRTIAPTDAMIHPDRRIDNILVGGPCSVKATKWTIDARPLKNGEHMSDHDAMIAHLQFEP